MTQNQSQEQVPWRPERPFWNPILEILSNPAIPYPAIRLEIESDPIHPMLTAAASSHALKTAPQRSPSGRFRNSKTPWPWRTERPLNQSQEQVPWRPECPFLNPTRNPWLLLLLLVAAQARNQQADTFFETQPKRPNTAEFRAENDANSIARTSSPERPFWNPTRNPLLSCYRARILSYPAIRLES